MKKRIRNILLFEKHRINFMASESTPGPKRLIFGLCTQLVSYLRAMTIKAWSKEIGS